MNVIVPTIMHSGTHPLMYLVLRNRHPDTDDWLFGPGTDNWIYHCHVDWLHLMSKETVECLAFIHNEITFAPMRHPARVLESFNREFREYSDFVYQWKFFKDIVHPHVDQYLHIDQIGLRMEQVEKMSEITGLDLHTDFPINQTTAGCLRGTHDFPLDCCPEVPEWMVDFYEETME